MHITSRINIKHLNHQVLLFQEHHFCSKWLIDLPMFLEASRETHLSPYPRGKAGGEPSGLKSSDEIKDRQKQPGVENDDTVRWWLKPHPFGRLDFIWPFFGGWSLHFLWCWKWLVSYFTPGKPMYFRPFLGVNEFHPWVVVPKKKLC